MWKCFFCDTEFAATSAMLEVSYSKCRVSYFCENCGANRSEWLDRGLSDGQADLAKALDLGMPIKGTEVLAGEILVSPEGLIEFSEDTSPYVFSIVDGQLKVALKKVTP